MHSRLAVTRLAPFRPVTVLACVVLAACGSRGGTDAPAFPPASVCGGGETGRCLVVAPGPNDQETLLSVLIEAQPGDVIVLKKGRYRVAGQLSLDVDDVTIRGEGMNESVISFAGQRSGGEGLYVTADRFTIEDVGLEDSPGDQLKVVGADGLTIRRVRAEWTGGPATTNGSYGLYPVQCRNVLIEDSVVKGASDAGVYVGQSRNVVVRGNDVQYNVAGIEIENSQDADVYENLATHNTGGILVFNLPGLPVKNGKRTRIFRNRVVANDTANFAAAGNIVHSVPTGTGVMVMANDDVEVFDNDLEDNGTTQVLNVSFRTAQLIGAFQADDILFDPFSEGILVTGNRIVGGGDDPDPETGPLISQILGLAPGAPLPAVLVDGDFDPAKLVGGALPGALRTCVDQPEDSFGSLDLPGGFAGATTDPSAWRCTLSRLPAIEVPANPLSPLPGDLQANVPPVGGDEAGETRCAPAEGTGVSLDPDGVTCNLLSSYRLFLGDGSSQEPNVGVEPYDLNTTLFSDDASKHRFVWLPAGQTARYDAHRSFDFPVGTVIVKTFAYPVDARDPTLGERLIETRLLIRRTEKWVPATYLWNDQQTEATLKLVGETRPVSWIDAGGEALTNSYNVPNVNQCKECHAEVVGTVGPLGPKARHLNREHAYAGGVENQLARWSRLGLLKGAPDPSDAPRAAVFDDPSTGSLEARARAYLDVNCSSCHNAQGPARSSGLYLSIHDTDPTALGICKSPVAAGIGSGGLLYDIEPGSPDRSILLYRMRSTQPGVAMPELGRSLVHDEAIAVLDEWIAAMSGGCPSPASSLSRRP